jgi:hypothetical protein
MHDKVIAREEIPSDVNIPGVSLLNVDPRSKAFKLIQPVCDPANPSRCLLATLGTAATGRRCTFTFKHTPSGPKNGVFKVFFGKGYGAERRIHDDDLPWVAMLHVASRFDKGLKVAKPARALIDLDDGHWTFFYRDPQRAGVKNAGNNYGRGENNKQIKSARARTLAAARAEAELAGLRL